MFHSHPIPPVEVIELNTEDTHVPPVHVPAQAVPPVPTVTVYACGVTVSVALYDTCHQPPHPQEFHPHPHPHPTTNAFTCAILCVLINYTTDINACRNLLKSK